MEPGSAEYDRVTTSVGDIENEVFFVMAHSKRCVDFSVDAAHRMTVDSNGGARVFLGNGEEVVVLDEGGTDEVRGGAGVDHDSGEGCDFSTSQLSRNDHVARRIEGGETTRFI